MRTSNIPVEKPPPKKPYKRQEPKPKQKYPAWSPKQLIQETVDYDPKFRLPDGARFEAVYSAQHENWTIKLFIGEVVIEKRRRGIHDALRRAGHEYSWSLLPEEEKAKRVEASIKRKAKQAEEIAKQLQEKGIELPAQT